MTHLALHLTRFVNGVAMRHGEVSRGMFPEYPINSITNGVHATTWTGPAFGELFDRRIPEWRRDNLYLRYAVSIPLAGDPRGARRKQGARCSTKSQRRTGEQLDPQRDDDRLRAPRDAVQARRPDLLTTSTGSRRSRGNVGRIQIVFGGKAHPHDGGGKELIRRIFDARASGSATS